MSQTRTPSLNGHAKIRLPELGDPKPQLPGEPLTYESLKHELVGFSPAMQKVKQLIARIAQTDATVLIVGPSGTGKELVARALHNNSLRRDHSLVTVLCSMFQENMLESELFGHERGSFTSAYQMKQGLAEMAEGGTLFIDEVAEMSPPLQARLLRFLEDGSYRRVGGTQNRQANVRIVAATNKPLLAARRDGQFRDDLYHRLNVITITLPPLKDRREDITDLIEHFLNTRGPERAPCRVSLDALKALVNYDWPGNVRELANVLHRAQILTDSDTITLNDLPEALLAVEVDTSNHEEESLNLLVVERRLIQEALGRTQGNRPAAARLIGVSVRALYRMIERLGITALLAMIAPTSLGCAT